MTDLHSIDTITEGIIGAAIKVHRQLGPGLLHSAYLPCLTQELLTDGRKVEVEKPISLRYGDVTTDCAFRIDLMVDDLHSTHGRFGLLGLAPSSIEARPAIDHDSFTVREPAGHVITIFSSHASGGPV